MAISHPKLNFNERDAMWKKILFCLMSLGSLALTACNTIEGVGLDLQHAGQAIQGEAKEHKGY